jgi:hypothetical protein
MNAIKIQSFFIIIVLIFGITASVRAGWFDKGKELLRSFSGSSDAPTLEEVSAGLKEALRVGADAVVSQLGSLDGFNDDKTVHIPLPEELHGVKEMLDKVGMAKMLEDLELKLNRAAEAATPKAKRLFHEAISRMTFDDVKEIYNGPDDAATQYFREKMTPGLAREMEPIISSSLAQVGAVKAYDDVMEKYQSLPFVPDVKADLTNWVVEKGMDGIFYYMAREEAAIRRDPAKRTTELLRRVFGSRI